MSDIWLTHPELTPAHDFKAPRASLGAWARSGWREREDQTDPPGYAEQEAERLAAAEAAADAVAARATAGDPTAPDNASTTRTRRD